MLTRSRSFLIQNGQVQTGLDEKIEHRDPGDCLLISTAIELACPLVTYDERIARFGERRGREYRFAVSA